MTWQAYGRPFDADTPTGVSASNPFDFTARYLLQRLTSHCREPQADDCGLANIAHGTLLGSGRNFNPACAVGLFGSRQRDARVGGNQRTGETVSVDAKRVPYFKRGKDMRERLNLSKVTQE